MQIANARLRLNKVGSDVPVVGMTPAEALLLHVLHQANNGGSTFGEEFDKIEIKGDAEVDCQVPDKVEPDRTETIPPVGVYGQPGFVAGSTVVHKGKVLSTKPGKRARTDSEEVRRLTAKYGHCVNKKGDKIVKLIWPELQPKLPQKFSDLDWKEIQYDGVEVAALNYATGTPTTAK